MRKGEKIGARYYYSLFRLHDKNSGFKISKSIPPPQDSEGVPLSKNFPEIVNTVKINGKRKENS